MHFFNTENHRLGKKKVYENYLCVSRVSMHVGVDKASFCDL